jgi:protein involved in polysaccharide export with SLBB domain
MRKHGKLGGPCAGIDGAHPPRDQRPVRPGSFLFAIFAAIALILGVAWSEAGAEDYRLGPQDRVRLKVYEWRASRDMIFEWTALNDQFTVSCRSFYLT